jgi:hypothetical protein
MTRLLALLALLLFLPACYGVIGANDDDAVDDDDAGDDDAGDDDAGDDDAGDDDAGDDDAGDDDAGDDDAGDDDAGDDDAGDDDAAPGAPSLTVLSVCEEPDPQQGCPSGTPGFVAFFTLAITDPDGDLQNPTLGISVAGGAPQAQQLQQNLGAGGGVGLEVCADWPRGVDIAYAITITDAAGNTSAPASGTWAVPANAGDGDCP